MVQRDVKVAEFEREIEELKKKNGSVSAADLDLVLKQVELQTKLEELQLKRREAKYSKFVTILPLSVPLGVAILTFTGVMLANGLQTWREVKAPRSAYILKAIEVEDRLQAVDRLLFLHEAGLISLKPRQVERLTAILSEGHSAKANITSSHSEQVSAKTNQ